MNKKIGEKIRKIREIKGYSQDYMSRKLNISQRAYSKMENDETKIDWLKIEEISSILEVEPMDLVNFDETMIFNYSPMSERTPITNHNFPEILIKSYEDRIAFLENEILFLRKIIEKHNEK